MEVGDLATWAGVVVALGVAVQGLRQGRQAQKAASVAVDEARRANEIADRTLRQQSEHHDVRWQSGFAFGTTRWQVQNIGTSVALDVRLEVTVTLDQTLSARVDEVPPQEALEIDLSEALRFEFELAENLQQRAPALPLEQTQPTLPIRQSIRWRTEAGMERQERLPEHAVPLRRQEFPTLDRSG